MSSSTPPSATPDPASFMTPPMAALRHAFSRVNDITAWNHCLGLARLTNIPTIANELANHVIVVCLDCEHWSDNSDLITEIGVGTFKTQDMVPIVTAKNHGDHGENMMKRIRFFLFRIIEHSHLPRSNPYSRGVEGNRFGAGRFVNFEDAGKVLHSVFVQPITNVASLKGCNHPIVVLGQDVAHDQTNLKNKDVGFDMDSLGTVVRSIDTQILARNVNFWLQPRQDVGLKNLVDRLGFEHTDPHTAANDAGRTLICAFQIALRSYPCKQTFTKDMQTVATAIEAHSRATFQSIGGSALYCWKCGSHNHMQSNCTATGLRCTECWDKGRFQDAGTHIKLHCLHIARENAIARRKRHEMDRLTRVKPPRRGHGYGGPAARGGPSGTYIPPRLNYEPAQPHGPPPSSYGSAYTGYGGPGSGGPAPGGPGAGGPGAGGPGAGAYGGAPTGRGDGRGGNPPSHSTRGSHMGGPYWRGGSGGGSGQ